MEIKATILFVNKEQEYAIASKWLNMVSFEIIIDYINYIKIYSFACKSLKSSSAIGSFDFCQ